MRLHPTRQPPPPPAGTPMPNPRPDSPTIPMGSRPLWLGMSIGPAEDSRVPSPLSSRTWLPPFGWLSPKPSTPRQLGGIEHAPDSHRHFIIPRQRNHSH